MNTYKINDNEYEVSWCDLCGYAILCCKYHATTCNCAGCEDCIPDFGDKEKIKEFEKEFLKEIKDLDGLNNFFPLKHERTEFLDALMGKSDKTMDELHQERKENWDRFVEVVNEY